MKLLCETAVQYRQQASVSSSTASAGGGRSQKSTLALGQHPPNKENAELFMILFTTANQTGTRYKVTGNLEKVFVKFVHQGKATISLKQPPHDVQIRCDAVQLKCFLQALKLGLEGKSASKMGIGSLAITPIPKASHPVTKLVVTSRGDYPVRGLPKTLKTLIVNGIQRCRLDSQILFLKNLTTLDLRDNAIEDIPQQLGQMPLILLDMASNRLGSGKGDWKWLEGAPLQQSLQHLVLCSNQIKFFPIAIIKMKRLSVLRLDFNEITRIPFAIRRLKSLRVLHLSNNRIDSLPHTLTYNSLTTIDITENAFFSDALPQPAPTVPSSAIKRNVPDLWEIAGRVVFKKKIPYGPLTLPRFLMDLLEETPLCPCGLICFTGEVYRKCRTMRLRSEYIVRDNSSASVLLADSVFCTTACFVKYADRYNRQ